MKFSSTLLFLAASLAAAQTPTTTDASAASSTCNAENIVQACLGSTQPIVDACASTDYDCKCSAIASVLTCYNNCPGDTGRTTVEQQQLAWCNAASAYPSTATISHSAVSTGSVASTTSAGAMQTTGTATQPAPSATDTGAAGALVAPLGLVGLVWGAAVLL